MRIGALKFLSQSARWGEWSEPQRRRARGYIFDEPTAATVVVKKVIPATAADFNVDGINDQRQT